MTSGSWSGDDDEALSYLRKTSSYADPWSLAVSRNSSWLALNRATMSSIVALADPWRPPYQRSISTGAASVAVSRASSGHSGNSGSPSPLPVWTASPDPVVGGSLQAAATSAAAIRTAMRTWRRVTRFSLSSLDRARGEAPDDLAGECEEQQKHRQGHDERGGDGDVGVGDLGADDVLQGELGGLLAIVVDDRLGPQVLVPGTERRDDDERRADGPGERHREPPEEAHVPVAVEAGGVVELGRDAAGPLAGEERAERRGPDRQHQAGVGVDPAQLADRLHVGQQRDLQRQQQRGHEQGEHQRLEREPQEGEGVRGQDRGQHLGHGDERGDREAALHGGADVALVPTPVPHRRPEGHHDAGGDADAHQRGEQQRPPARPRQAEPDELGGGQHCDGE